MPSTPGFPLLERTRRYARTRFVGSHICSIKLVVKARCWSNAVNVCCRPCGGDGVPPAPSPPWCCRPFCCSAFIELFHLLLALKDSALRPVRLLWLRLTSPLLSRAIARAVVRCIRTRAEISSGKACLLLADPSDLPYSVPNDNRASPSLAGLPNAEMALYPLSVRRIPDFVVGFLQIPPRGGHPCLDGWFRSSRSMGDFHPLNTSHTEHTRVRPRLNTAVAARSSRILFVEVAPSISVPSGLP
jgi:hypothetical protein